MKVSNNEITIQRGEAFSLDRTVMNKDGSPYIVSNQLRNPHILITVSNSKYDEANKYCAKYYLPMDIPRFLFTNVINLKDLKQSANGSSQYNTFPQNLTLFSNGNNGPFFMQGYMNGVLTCFEPDDAVFYLDTSNGRQYKYWVSDSDEDGSGGHWEDYVFRFVKFFDSGTTSKWSTQTYFYSINIVSGNLPIESEEYDNVIVLLPSTKLSVLSNLRGRK